MSKNPFPKYIARIQIADADARCQITPPNIVDPVVQHRGSRRFPYDANGWVSPMMPIVGSLIIFELSSFPNYALGVLRLDHIHVPSYRNGFHTRCIQERLAQLKSVTSTISKLYLATFSPMG
eukprot:5422966-Karenia_brevis.AAC.1